MAVPSTARTESTRVTGTVVTLDGSVVPSASVEAVRLTAEGGDVTLGQLQWKLVDAEGNFQLDLPPGRYEVRAKDEKDGYPDPNFLLSKDPDSGFPVIIVDGQEVSEITVKLGTRGGILEGEVVDRASRSPVSKAKVIIADAMKPHVVVELFPDKSGHFLFALPSKALRISGSAPGYAAVSVAGPITLASGEHRKILIELTARTSASPLR